MEQSCKLSRDKGETWNNQKEEAGYKSKLRSCSQNRAQQWTDSQNAPQGAVKAVLARSFWGLKRSVTGHFLRDQRTGFRAWFPPVFKIWDNKSTAVLSNVNQKFLGKALIIWILLTPYLPFPQHMEPNSLNSDNTVSPASWTLTIQELIRFGQQRIPLLPHLHSFPSQRLVILLT